MKVKFKIIEDEKIFRNKTAEEFNKHINTAIKKAAPKIKEDIQFALFHIFQQTPIYEALINGPLNAHFGFPIGSERDRVNEVIQGLSESINIKYGKRKYPYLEIGIIDEYYDNALNQPGSVVVTEDGTNLNWVEWLLFRGTEIIIAGYDIKFTRGGRSREAIMVDVSSRGWSVPIKYAGTQNNNWVTQTLNDSSKLIYDFIENIVSTRIKENL